MLIQITESPLSKEEYIFISYHRHLQKLKLSISSLNQCPYVTHQHRYTNKMPDIDKIIASSTRAIAYLWEHLPWPFYPSSLSNVNLSLSLVANIVVQSRKESTAIRGIRITHHNRISVIFLLFENRQCHTECSPVSHACVDVKSFVK